MLPGINFNFLKSDIHEHLEKLQLLVKAHRLDQCLVTVTQVHGTPDWCFLYVIFLAQSYSQTGGRKYCLSYLSKFFMMFPLFQH